LQSTARRLFLVAALAAPLACGTQGGTVSIGTAGPWTTGFGAMNRRGIDMAVAEINARGLAGEGRTIQLVARDDKAEGSTAATIAQQFVDDDAIVAVVGHVTSGAMMAASKVYDGHLAAVATTATSPDLTGISPWTFRVISSDSTNGQDLARFAARLGARRAAVIYENDSYGRGLTESFRRHFHGEIVSIDPIGPDASDFEPYIAYYQRVDPDLVFVAGTEGSGVAILREAKRQGLRALFLGGDGWTGVVTDPMAAEGAYVGAPFSAQDPRPEARRFVEAFRKRYNMLPDGNAAMGYDATMVVARAIAEAGPSRAKIRDWLASRTAVDAVPGVSGPIRFEENGDPVGRALVMTRVRDGILNVEAAR
jgi:branched-chain amino acid transport system substrate-binding protein